MTPERTREVMMAYWEAHDVSKQAIPTSREQHPSQLGRRLMTREHRLKYVLGR